MQPRAPGRRRELALEALEAVAVEDLHMARLAEIGRQDAVIGRMPLEQAHLVLRAQQRVRDRGRPRVLLEPAARVEGAHLGDVIGERGRQVVARPESADALRVLALLLRVAAFQRIPAGAGVRVDVAVAFFLRVQVAQHQREHHVLEHVGVVAGVKGVAVGEHRVSG